MKAPGNLASHDLQLAVVLPTYNEAENLPALVAALLALPLTLRILVVDDNSPDGTGAVAERLKAAHPGRLEVLHRKRKAGLGPAYLAGFRQVLTWDVDAIAQMDADFSHPPELLPRMAATLRHGYDLVIGSRYVPGGGVDPKWPRWRQGLSRFGNRYARTILGLPWRDLTSGYRLWRKTSLAALPLERIRSNGYVFLVEMAYVSYLLGYRVAEVPFLFLDRRHGRSKMSLAIQVEAALRVWTLRRAYRDLRSRRG